MVSVALRCFCTKLDFERRPSGKRAPRNRVANRALIYAPPCEGWKVLSSYPRLPTEAPLAIQLLNRLVKFFIEVADHVIKGDVLLPLGLKVVLVLNEPRVDFLTHLDCLHTPPLWTASRCFRSVPSFGFA